MPEQSSIVIVEPTSASRQRSMKRWLKDFSDFFFVKGNVLALAIAVVVGDQVSAITKSLSADLLMPLINPFIPQGSFKDLAIPYFGGPIAIGNLLDTFLSAFLVAWALFMIIQAMKRIERIGRREDTPAD